MEGWKYVQIGRGFAQVVHTRFSSLDLDVLRLRLLLKLEKRQNYVLTHIYVYEWLVLWLWPLMALWYEYLDDSAVAYP